VLRCTLQGGGALAASVVDLTGSIVTFHMKDNTGAVVVNVAAVVTDFPNGIVEHRWLPPHTAQPGNYFAEFEVIYADLRIETFPNSGSIPINITPDIA